MRVLVTGGAGFLGSHLCDRLIADGHHVVSLDDYSSGRPENLRQLEGNPRLHALRADVRHPIELAATPLDGLDRLYHLACPASPTAYQRDPIGTARTAFQGTLEALELARRTGARFLLASTSEVYGDPEVHPQPETYLGHVNPIGPRACYDEGKRIAETLSFDFARQHGVDIRVARIFNTYGPRMADDGRVVMRFLASARRGEPLVVHGAGDQTRSFCFVSDMIEGLTALMEANEVQGPVNLGNDHEVTILELAQAIIQLLRSGQPIEHLPEREDDPSRRCPDMGVARRHLGWMPSVQLEEGLAHTLAWLEGRSPAGSNGQ